jgi:hypothetical protein
VAHTQALIRKSEQNRLAFWSRGDFSSAEKWKSTTKPKRDYIWDEVIGRLPDPSVPPNPRTRLIFDEPKFLGYEVMLDVWPGIFASGILLVPKNIQPGERRPVVVCQHGLAGRPRDVADPKVDSAVYHGFAVRLANEGFVTFAPQNPYIGQDRFRQIQRKAHPLKLSLFSFILGQHQRLLEWLGGLPFVDRQRIGFYGLSYGGKTAVRVPPCLMATLFPSARRTSTNGSGRQRAPTRATAIWPRRSTTCWSSTSQTSSITPILQILWRPVHSW